jgi:hypothetical protein
MATLDPVTNFASSLVATAPSPATSGTSLIVSSGEGTLFPDPSTAGAYNLVVWPATDMPTVSNAEIVRVTAKSTDTLTITRQQESTSARTVVVGDRIALTPTKKFRDDAEGGLGGGASIYECTVGVSGADYATLGAAITAGKTRILVIDKTTEVANIALPSYLVLHGARTGDLADYYIDMSTFQLTGNALYMSWFNVSIKTSRTNVDAIFTGDISSSHFDNCTFFDGLAAAGGGWFFGLKNNQFTRCRFASTRVRLIYNNSGSSESYVSTFIGCYFSGSADLANDSYYLHMNKYNVGATGSLGFYSCYFSLKGRLINASLSSNLVTQKSAIKFDNCLIYSSNATTIASTTYAPIRFDSCYIESAGSTPGLVYMNGSTDVTFDKCSFRTISKVLTNDPSSSGYRVALNDCTFMGVGELAIPSTDTPTYEPLVTVSNSMYSPNKEKFDGFAIDRKIVQVVNPAATTINQGEVVTLEYYTTSVGNKLKIATTTTADDAKVFGIALRYHPQSGKAPVLIQGLTYHLKVNGSVDIAAGDLLGTHTVAGIAAKSTTRGARKFMALEAYTDDDSNGNIKALVYPEMK